MNTCSYCSLPLGDSPSDWYCDDDCQRRWHSMGTLPLPQEDTRVGEFQSTPEARIAQPPTIRQRLQARFIRN